MTKMNGFTLGLLVLAGLSACDREKTFLYYHPDHKPGQAITEDRSVLEAVGTNYTDILWVIDNSASMDDEAAILKSNLNQFMGKFIQSADIQWRMGVISTNAQQKPFLGFTTWFDNAIANPVSVFQKTVTEVMKPVGTSGDELAFQSVKQALDLRPDFSRKDVPMSLIVMTDETSQGNVNAKQMADYFKKLKGKDKLVRFYGIFSAFEDGCSGGFQLKGTEYEKFMSLVPSKKFVLCKDFAASLSVIADAIVTYVKSPKLYLNRRPDPDTIRIFFKGSELPSGPKADGGMWVYDYQDNVILFHSLDFAGNDTDKVQVEYTEDNGWD